MIKKGSFFIASLGCAKNSVDSESMAYLLKESGHKGMERPDQAEFLIVNTCGFIQQAREESLSVLEELALHMRPGQQLIASGCLPERYRDMIIDRVPGIHGLISTKRWMDILTLLSDLKTEGDTSPRYHLPETPTIGVDEKGVPRVAVQGASAYLKIADGCRRPCAFCSIPLIKGTTVSRPMDAIIREGMILQDQGVKELILIAQDTTDYGSDLGMKDGLVQLLERLLPKIPGIPWVRILYAYPGFVSDSLIELMASSPQILPYLDIPLQHAHPDMLRRMKRPANMDWVRNTIAKMRERIPDLALRTTFITGFPGETDNEFNTLMDFVEEIRFDRFGVFPYSFEPGTSAEPLGDPIPEETKIERAQELMQIQEQISMQKNKHWIGRDMDVLIEGSGDGISIGRSFRDAPEIDGLVIIEGEVEAGQILPVHITGAMTHDLSGIIKT